MIQKTINVNELQSQISSVLKEVQSDTVYEVMRYSDPIAVVLSYKDYTVLKGDCKQCIKELKGIAATIKGSK